MSLPFLKSGEITLEIKHEKIGILTLCRPDSSNAYSEIMIDELVQSLRYCKKNEKLHCLMITGSGGYFSAGGDVKSMQSKTGMFAGDSYELMLRYQQGIQEIAPAMIELSVPTIALINGPAIGAGMDLALMCDFRIMSKNAFMCHSFGKLNLIPGDGGAYFLTRLVGYSTALYLNLTAKKIVAEEALSLKMVNQICSEGELLQEGIQFAQRITELPASAIKLSKESFRNAEDDNLQNHLKLMSSFQSVLQRMPEHQSRLDKMLQGTKKA